MSLSQPPPSSRSAVQTRGLPVPTSRDSRPTRRVSTDSTRFTVSGPRLPPSTDPDPVPSSRRIRIPAILVVTVGPDPFRPLQSPVSDETAFTPFPDPVVLPPPTSRARCLTSTHRTSLCRPSAPTSTRGLWSHGHAQAQRVGPWCPRRRSMTDIGQATTTPRAGTRPKLPVYHSGERDVPVSVLEVLWTLVTKEG